MLSYERQLQRQARALQSRAAAVLSLVTTLVEALVLLCAEHARALHACAFHRHIVGRSGAHALAPPRKDAGSVPAAVAPSPPPPPARADPSLHALHALGGWCGAAALAAAPPARDDDYGHFVSFD